MLTLMAKSLEGIEDNERKKGTNDSLLLQTMRSRNFVTSLLFKSGVRKLCGKQTAKSIKKEKTQKEMSRQVEILEQSIIKEVAEKKSSQEIREFRSMCIGTVDALEQIFRQIDPHSYQLFKKFRKIFNF